MLKYFARKRQAQLDAIGTEIKAAVRAEATRLQTDNAALHGQIDVLTRQCADLRRERDEFKARVREQTEADLVLVSARIIVKAINGEKDVALSNEQAQLQQHLAMLGLQHNPYVAAPFGGLLGGLGAGLASAFKH